MSRNVVTMNPDDIKSIIPVDKVYRDTLSPAMQQIGKALENVAKASRFLLAPIDYLATQHDRWERHLKKLSGRINDENLVEGHPQIVIPTIEGLSLTFENTLVCEFFIKLLANSIDKTKQDLAHPAFPDIIRQISRDEAVMLFYLKRKPYQVRQQANLNLAGTMFLERFSVHEEFPIAKLQFPKHFDLYMDHLTCLNLAAIIQVGEVEYIYDPETKRQTGVLINSERRLIPFGELFANSCVPDSFDGL